MPGRLAVRLVPAVAGFAWRLAAGAAGTALAAGLATLAPATALFATPAMGWRDWMRGRRAFARTLTALVLAGGALTTAAPAVWGFASEHGPSEGGWYPPTPAMSAAMAWARTRTPAEGAFRKVRVP